MIFLTWKMHQAFQVYSPYCLDLLIWKMHQAFQVYSSLLHWSFWYERCIKLSKFIAPYCIDLFDMKDASSFPSLFSLLHWSFWYERCIKLSKFILLIALIFWYERCIKLSKFILLIALIFLIWKMHQAFQVYSPYWIDLFDMKDASSFPSLFSLLHWSFWYERCTKLSKFIAPYCIDLFDMKDAPSFPSLFSLLHWSFWYERCIKLSKFILLIALIFLTWKMHQAFQVYSPYCIDLFDMKDAPSFPSL